MEARSNAAYNNAKRVPRKRRQSTLPALERPSGILYRLIVHLQTESETEEEKREQDDVMESWRGRRHP